MKKIDFWPLRNFVRRTVNFRAGGGLNMCSKRLNLFSGHATDDTFVKYVEDNPILWDNRCQDYKDCKEKALVWDSVGNACGITGEQARLKWVSSCRKYLLLMELKLNSTDR